MDLVAYFNGVEGTGVLATSNSSGRVNMAIYTKPHVIDPTTVAFVMKERLSHRNLTTNHHAAYLFMERRPGYHGLRLALTMLREEINHSLVEAMRQKQPVMFPAADDSSKFVVIFQVDQIRPLVGDYQEEKGDL
jgi:hypothetical protein